MTANASPTTSPGSGGLVPLTNAKFLQESNGKNSLMRLMSLFSFITAIIFGGVSLAKPDLSDTSTELTFMFLSAAFAPKVIQRFGENQPQ